MNASSLPGALQPLPQASSWRGGGAQLRRPPPLPAVPAAPQPGLARADCLGGMRAPWVRCAASKSSGGSKVKTIWRCEKCGAEHSQWMGQCRACKAWETLAEVTLTPEPPPGAASGASAAAAALRTRPAPSAVSGGAAAGGWRAAGGARGSGGGGIGAGWAGAAAAAGRLRHPDPEFAFGPSDDDDDDDDDDDGGGGGGGGPGLAAGALAARAAGVGGWVEVDEAAPPRPLRLDEINCSEEQLRVPLRGATGAEVARVLGGGLVPGSLVLVGGEPGMGKSTLLLQVAGLVAAACGGAPAGRGAAEAAGSDGEDDDLPLAARRAASGLAGLAGGGREAAAADWLRDALGDQAAGAAPLPDGCGGRPVLYITAEESQQQVWERARRLGLVGASAASAASAAGAGGGLDLRLLVENRVEAIAAAMAELQPVAVVVDSIQTVALRSVAGRAGSVTQVRESASCLLHLAKQLGCATFLVGHVTKGGSIAGPKHLEHLVDVVLYLQGSGGGRHGALRMLRAVKNRHGRVGEVGLFEMAGAGLAAVTDAAALFLPATAAAAAAAGEAPAGRGEEEEEGEEAEGRQLVGTAIAVVREGIRPLPLEVQALATPRLRPAAGRGASAAAAQLGEGEEGGGWEGWGGGGGEGKEEDEEGSEEDEGSLLGSQGSEPDGDWPGAAASRRRSRRSRRPSFGGDDDGSGDDGGGGAGPPPPAAELAPMYRHFIGLADRPRAAMLLELLSKYTPIKSHMYNLFVNVVAGYRIPPGETSADLAVLSAVASSVTNTPLPPGVALLGEVGLAGELRAVPDTELRLLEVAKLGFSQAVVPAAGPPLKLGPSELGGLQVVRVHSLRAALVHLFGHAALRAASGRGTARSDGGAGAGGGSTRSSGRPSSRAGWRRR